MNDETAAPLPPGDAALRDQLAAIIPEEAHATTLPKAIAAYEEQQRHNAYENAVLFAYQQLIIEGLSAALSHQNEADEKKLDLPKITNGGLVLPKTIKRYRS